MRRTSRIHLHIGAPKTGTSYLQDVLWTNRETLRRAGVLYPGLSPDAQFHAAMDLQGSAFQEHPDPAVPGAWERVVGQARGWRGEVVLSHELFSMADEATARRALDELSFAEVHIICTVRDLARQLPAVWQEDVKNRQVLTFAEFAAQLAAPGPDAHFLATLFWRLQDVPAVLRTWAAELPPERVHLVTVPRPGGPREELWNRFARAIGIDSPVPGMDLAGESNRSMGIAETNLLRRLNATIGDSLDWPSYDVLVKDFLALEVRGSSTASLALPAGDREWVRARAEAMVEELRAAGYPVVGDLAELRCAPTSSRSDGRHPDEVTDAEMLDSAMHALAGLLRYASTRTPPRQAAWRRRAVAISQQNAALGQLRRHYLAAKARRGG